MRDPFVIVFTLYFAVMSMLGLIVLWLTHRDDRERIRATVKLNTEGEACDALLRVIEEKDAKIDAMRDEHETELNANLKLYETKMAEMKITIANLQHRIDQLDKGLRSTGKQAEQQL